MIFETKIVTLSDGRLIHFDRSGCNNDESGRRKDEFTGRVYTQEAFKELIEKFKRDSEPFQQSGYWELKIQGKQASFYDYGTHLERMRKRAEPYEQFISERTLIAKRYDGVELISPERKQLSADEFDDYWRNLPRNVQMRYRVIKTTIDMANEKDFISQLESGKSIQLFIGPRFQNQQQVMEEPEEDMGMNMEL